MGHIHLQRRKSTSFYNEPTIVDSTIIKAPTSTKSREKKRDPEAHSTKKGNVWYFGYKAHVGVDRDSGLIYTVKSRGHYP